MRISDRSIAHKKDTSDVEHSEIVWRRKDPLCATHRDEARLYLSIDESWMPHQVFQKLDIRRRSYNLVLFESFTEQPERIGPIPPMDDQFSNHRIIMHTDLITWSESRVDAYGWGERR